MARKFVIYLEGASRGIVMTDDDNEISSDDLAQKVASKLTGFDVCEFRTKSDCLIVRPNQISAVHIQGGQFGKDVPISKKKAGKTAINDIIPDLDLGDIGEQKEMVVESNELDPPPKRKPGRPKKKTSEKIVKNPRIKIEKDDNPDIDITDVEAEVDAWHAEADANNE